MARKGLRLHNRADSSILSRREIINFYVNKYYNLYMNAYTWNGLDYQEKDFLMRKFWSDGKIAVIKLNGTEGSTLKPEGTLIFAPFVVNKLNLYDHPVSVTLVNLRNSSFIPRTPLKVDKEVVLGWTQRNKKSIYNVVYYYAKKLADTEMIIRTNLRAQKTPWLIGVSAESEAKMRTFRDNLKKDDPDLFLNLDEANLAKALVSGAPYIVDKLYAYKSALENELREYLGFKNLGNHQKKEHLITSEVEINSEVTESSEDCLYDMLTEFCDRIKEILNVTISVEINKADQYEEEDFEDE